MTGYDVNVRIKEINGELWDFAIIQIAGKWTVCRGLSELEAEAAYDQAKAMHPNQPVKITESKWCRIHEQMESDQGAAGSACQGCVDVEMDRLG